MPAGRTEPAADAARAAPDELATSPPAKKAARKATSAAKKASPAARKTPPPAESPQPATGEKPAPRAATAKRTASVRQAVPAQKTSPAKKAPTQKIASARKTAEKALPTKPAKATRARKATPPPDTDTPSGTPAEKPPAADAPTTLTPVISPPAPEVTVPGPDPWWSRGPAGPADVPHWLAEAAVERFADPADRYLRWLRATYPHATPDGLARAAIERFRRRPWYAAGAGPAGPVVLLAAEAELVLHVAAAYGHDPHDRQRVPELVALLAPGGLAGSLAARVVGRVVPGGRLVLGLLADRAALDQAARRAIAYYRPASVQEPQAIGE